MIYVMGEKTMREWKFTVYGIGTDTAASGYVAADGSKAEDSGSVKYSSGYVLTKPDGYTPIRTVEPAKEGLGEADFVRIWTWDGRGKIVPADTDGLAFYYTTINPQTDNFKFSAYAHVNNWRIGNGQEGFGLLAADRIGANGDAGYHWTNSYTAVASRMDYKWDSVNDRLSEAGDTDIVLRIGIGSTAKTGVSADNLDEFENDVTSAVLKYYKTETLPLDTTVHSSIYNNLIGNENLGSTKLIPDPIVDLKLGIELNATGYFISYTPLTKKPDGTFAEGRTATNKYYDRNALSMCEKDKVYLGFFATRHADVTFSNVVLDVTPYDSAEKAEEPPVKEIELKAAFEGAESANSEDCQLVYITNRKGSLVIKNETGEQTAQKYMEPVVDEKGGECRISIPVKLHLGENRFYAYFTPDTDHALGKDGAKRRLAAYPSKEGAAADHAVKEDSITVTWKQYGIDGGDLYVAPEGSDTGDGTKDKPLDIYTAVKYVRAGQRILLRPGIYKLSRTVRIEKGIDGSADRMICMMADNGCDGMEKGNRPIFDFNGQCEGMIITADWWHFKGFDVTRSANMTNGIRVCGSYNIFEGICVYKNGNTGLQITARRLSAHNRDEWPSYNRVINCTACLNADDGYTDSDGFAAKLAVGKGNVFEGCVSAYNADDGFDLFAKVWIGHTEPVTIKHCISFENGRVIRDKKTHELVWFNESDDYEIINAGCGNGFKLGGSSLSGYHALKDSFAFHNKLKGIDCNSCPDIQVYDSVSYDNDSSNVAMYSDAKKTDYKAHGIISYRSKTGLDIEDYIGDKWHENSLKVSTIINTQADCAEKIFNDSNFFWNKLSKVSEPGPGFYEHYTLWTDKDTRPEASETTVSDDWFVDIDYEKWAAGNRSSIAGIGRNGNGELDLHGFLELTPKGKAKSGRNFDLFV